MRPRSCPRLNRVVTRYYPDTPIVTTSDCMAGCRPTALFIIITHIDALQLLYSLQDATHSPRCHIQLAANGRDEAVCA